MDSAIFRQQRALFSASRRNGGSQPGLWHEQLAPDGSARPQFQRVFERIGTLPRNELRTLGERMAATMREMDVTFNVTRSGSGEMSRRRPWDCDLIPQVFTAEEWGLIERGTNQRLRAFDLFLSDVYGKKEILRQGVIPLRSVLGSPSYLHAALGIPPSGGHYLHLCGLSLTRDPGGRLAVRTHYFQKGSGISYMMQNRRILSRVDPDPFVDQPIASLAEVPLDILTHIQSLANEGDNELTAILLTPGPGSSAYSEHSFLARRMGMQLAQGGDLVVLGNRLYLKVVGGLEQVEVIYNRLAHAYIDPLACRRDSLIGVPGLAHCLRGGSASMLNALGSELADDRSLLCFSAQIIRFYLGEEPLLPTVGTYWLGDIDQREMVLENLAAYRIRPLVGEEVLGNPRGLPNTDRDEQAIRQAVRLNPQSYVAQTIKEGAATLAIEGSQLVTRVQDHTVFALRHGTGFRVFPGALTRISGEGSALTAFEAGGGSKDTWVLVDENKPVEGTTTFEQGREVFVITRKITSRVAESFYWLGRYLERLNSLSYMIQVMESLELEDLNAAERRHYRPIWSRLLPPVEGGSHHRRGIGSRLDRYLKMVRTGREESCASLVHRVSANADSIQEYLTPEAWSVLAELRLLYANQKEKPNASEKELIRVTKRLSEGTQRLVPRFYAVAEMTLLADEGLHLWKLGIHLEVAIITANAVLSIQSALRNQLQRSMEFDHATEIELSAFLRLLGSRDAYRRVHQMRARPLQVLELLWQSEEAPRSVLHALQRCADVLRKPAMRQAMGTSSVLEHVEALVALLCHLDWNSHIDDLPKTDTGTPRQRAGALQQLLAELYHSLLKTHDLVTDGFLSHQAHIPTPDQSSLKGFGHGI